MHRNAVILTIFVLLVAAAVILRSVPSRPDSRPSAAPGRAVHPTRAGAFRGFSLQLHNADPEGKTLKLVDEVAQTSANTLCLVIHAYQDNLNSTSIFIDARKTPSDKHLGRLIDRAHEKGLQVAVMPVVLLTNKRESTDWRGRIKPDNWEKWWHDYRAFILRYAHLAGAHDVEIFSVGSELLSTETHVDRWQALIADVREACDSRLTYSANWDRYQAPPWWDRLDIIGMTSYHELAAGSDPSLEELKQAWEPIRREILDWQKGVNRPILFTEVGWPNQATAARYPWNYYAAVDQPAPQLQARLFEAFFQTWTDQSGVAGILVWEWKWKPEQDTAPQSDTSYCPLDKPAMDVIDRYFRAAHAAEVSSDPPSQPNEDL
jgi:hypothetical protein